MQNPGFCSMQPDVGDSYKSSSFQAELKTQQKQQNGLRFASRALTDSCDLIGNHHAIFKAAEF
jgi:hypothetical protein